MVEKRASDDTVCSIDTVEDVPSGRNNGNASPSESSRKNNPHRDMVVPCLSFWPFLIVELEMIAGEGRRSQMDCTR